MEQVYCLLPRDCLEQRGHPSSDSAFASRHRYLDEAYLILLYLKEAPRPPRSRAPVLCGPPPGSFSGVCCGAGAELGAYSFTTPVALLCLRAALAAPPRSRPSSAPGPRLGGLAAPKSPLAMCQPRPDHPRSPNPRLVAPGAPASAP